MQANAYPIADIVDFERFPIVDLTSAAGKEVLATCRASMASRGACRLERFLKPPALAAIVAEAKVLAPKAFRHDQEFRVYIGEDMPERLPADDPRHVLARSAQACIAWDLISGRSALRALYEWDGLTDFIRAVLEKPKLYRSADPIGACSVAFTEPGGELGWHFDTSEFSVTLQLQAPDEGGEFQFSPNIRSAGNENYSGVKQLLSGDLTGVIRSASPAGTLAIFRGHDSIHRVTKVAGKTPRITAVLTYADVPDFLVSDYSRQMFYGRTEPIARRESADAWKTIGFC
jgi:hypothetical protein